MLKVINLMLVISILITSFFITNQRYIARHYYMKLNELQNQADNLNQEYTRLQIEEGTYASNLSADDYVAKQLNLIRPDQKHIVGINSNE